MHGVEPVAQLGVVAREQVAVPVERELTDVWPARTLEAAREVEALDRLVDLAYGRGPGPVGYQLLTPTELSTVGG